MTPLLPEILLPFQAAAEAIIAEGLVKAVEFSGGTYQIQIEDRESEDSVWTFLQLNEKQKLKDCFCSCQGSEDTSKCPHLAAAFLAIYGNHKRPLHIRYEQSVWYQLARVAYFSLGDTPSDISTAENRIGIGTSVELQGLTEHGMRQLTDIVIKRPVQTEETSLKFSNLSIEEIKRWKEGRPSRQLCFELSYWNDLFRWMMLLQEKGEAHSVRYTFDYKGIPDSIHIAFPAIECTFNINQEWLLDIIPFLNTVNSSLIVHSARESIASIEYDSKKKEFTVTPRPIDPILDNRIQDEGVLIGKWIYLPKEGFYPIKPHPLLQRKYSVHDVLHQYPDLLQELMQSPSLHLQPVIVSHQLHFDPDWNLHVALSIPRVGRVDAAFGDWGYVEGMGFYHLDEAIFVHADQVIPEEKVVEFINKQRHWLDLQPGFQTHIAGIETIITYQMIGGGRLVFSRQAVLEEGEGEAKDFGQWVYVLGQGFYPKVNSHIHLPIQETLVISRDQIPLFIRANQDELEMVPGFFSGVSPVERSGLCVELRDPETIMITPEFQLSETYRFKDVKFFEEFTYVEGEGFFLLPPRVRLPDRFMHTIYLKRDQFTSFLTYEIETIRDSILVLDPQLKPPRSLKLVIDSIEKSEGHYHLTLHYASGRGSISFDEIFEAKKSSERYLFSPNGLIDTEDERFQWMNEVEKGDPVQLTTLELFRLSIFDPPTVSKGKELLDELMQLRVRSEPDLSLLHSHLRPYQEVGLHWLWFLYQHQLSGLLCDDMGLGKTHQTMALIAAAKKQQSDRRPFLVVCPTSVIYHWEDKLEQFLPDFKVRTYYGIARSLDGFSDEDILLTSYGVWRKDHQQLKKIAFDVAVFDEIQSAKNQKSRIHTSLLSVSAAVKIGLTGTPIENRLRELKSLFDLILPGYMPSESIFKEFFVIPVERAHSRKRKELLSRFVKPFMLRRRKEEVLLDLPEKIEEVAHCELSLDQKILYSELLSNVRGNLVQQLKNQSNPVPYLHIFSVLSSLKQICNHPAAYLKNPKDYKEYHSGKWELFEELVTEALESGQKIVVFSQYLAMLDIFENYFKENRIEFASIRGQTVNRGEQVRRFNQDMQCRVFLGSLQAAGLGIDLTAGSVVIHYDRWWNAAREDQATDRVHRIGQKRGVQVFKLVTKGTLEERIDEMILRKGKLMEEVVGIDDHRFMKSFDRDELIELLTLRNLQK